MFVPIVFTLEPAAELSWMWVFHKMVSMGKGYNWPIIAQQEYFSSYDRYEVSEAMKSLYDVPIDKEGALENIISIPIPDDIISCFRDKFPSETDAYMHSYLDEWDELVDYLYHEIKCVFEHSKRPIEGLILFKYHKCFEILAEKLSVPTFYFEMGALRTPDYRNTFYWSKEGLMGKAGLDKRYERFKIELKNSSVLILNPQEILALFLEKDKLDYINVAEEKKYEFGILGGYSIPTPGSAFNAVTWAEELSRVRRVCANDKIFIKLHPGDPLLAVPRGVDVESPGITAAQFIKKCKRIVCAASNVTYEAALYGVPSYDVGWSQYAFISNKLSADLADCVPDNMVLSFIAFVCLAPIELLKDIAYLRMLITTESFVELYNSNFPHRLV